MKAIVSKVFVLIGMFLLVGSVAMAQDTRDIRKSEVKAISKAELVGLEYRSQMIAEPKSKEINHQKIRRAYHVDRARLMESPRVIAEPKK